MSVPFATQAVSLDVMAIPDFIAGFMFGFTGENHLAEIEQCYSGGEGLLNDVQSALSDIKAGSFVKGIEDIGMVINDFPDALANC